MTTSSAEDEQGTARAKPREGSLPLWVRLPLAGIVIGVITVRALGPITDPDTYWHVAAGAWLRKTGSFSGQDPWSLSSTNPWILHEWLPELLMNWSYQAFGLAGVAWLHTLLVAILGLALWMAIRRRAALLLTAVVLAVAFIAMSASVSPRPQMVTFIFTVVTVDAWLRTSSDLRPRWWLVPLSWIWAISHGMWFVGLVVGLVALTGMALDHATDVKRLAQLALIPLGSVSAAALTPAGPSLLAAPFQVSEYTQFVTEWQPPALTDIFFVAFIVLAGATVTVWVRRQDRVRWSLILLAGLAGALALRYSRTVAVGAAIMAPITAATLQAQLGLIRERLARREVVFTAALVSSALIVAAVLAPFRATSPGLGPTGLDRELDALPSGTVVCNDYALGGWMIWRHPDLHPAIDGRIEVYSVQHVRNYTRFLQAAPGWQRFPETTGCRWALVEAEAPVVEALESRLSWTRVGAADGYALLRAPQES